MRYEHLEFDLSTAACSFMLEAMGRYSKVETQPGVETELSNVRNELRARLQRTDQDPNAAVPAEEDWLA
jgi:hypothetical protein